MNALSAPIIPRTSLAGTCRSRSGRPQPLAAEGPAVCRAHREHITHERASALRDTVLGIGWEWSALAVLYGVTPKALNQAARRNRDRFPADFMFQLTADETARLRSQIVTLETGRGRHRKYRPYAFTEQGSQCCQASWRSRAAVRVNVGIMRAFVRLRRILDSNAELARKLDELERRYDGQFRTVFDAIRQLMAPPEPPRPRIGFRARLRIREDG